MVNGPPPGDLVTPITCGLGGEYVKETGTTSSVAGEKAGKPDPGKPGGPSDPDSGEGGKGGATGEGPDSKGGTDVATCGGAKGTNVEPVGPAKPVPKPVTPKPSSNNGGPGTDQGKEEVFNLI